MKSIFLALLIAMLLVAGGAAIYCIYGYKDSFWIKAAAYMLIILGWMCPLFLFMAGHTKIARKKRTAGSRIGFGLYFLTYPVWLAVLVIGFLKLDEIKDGRVNRILASDEVGVTTAKVVRIEERRVKYSSHMWAVVEYNADGTSVQQAIKDDLRLYNSGDELKIRYSKEYPDMFAVVPDDSRYHRIMR